VILAAGPPGTRAARGRKLALVCPECQEDERQEEVAR
jgi:hypothetical protein